MKSHQTRLDELLDRYLGLYKASSRENPAAAKEAILQKMRSQCEIEIAQESSQEVRPKSVWRLKFVAASVAVVLVLSILIVASQRSERFDAHAIVESGDGKILEAGDYIESGRIVSTNGAGATLVLGDGSRVEMRAQSELVLERADDGVRIRLSQGDIIVNAAKQRTGHLYVQTKDLTVSVIGTVFFVNAEEGGSRVAVIQGEVHVQQGATIKKLLPGQQVATSSLMEPQLVSEEIAWSSKVVAHMALLQQSIAVPAEPLQFEVISIKLPYYPRTARFACRGIDGMIEPYLGVGPSASATVIGSQGKEEPLTVPNGRCFGQPDLIQLVSIAYGIPTYDISVNGPDWVVRRQGAIQRFSIDAKAENTAIVTKQQLRQMLQSMLADRFKLRIRWESREAQGFALLVAKGGLKVKEASGDIEYPHPAGDATRPLGDLLIKGKSSMKDLADFLMPSVSQGQTAYPVVDKTGLPGIFEYTLALHQIAPSSAPRGAGGDPGGGYDPTVARSLEQQLGLTLQPMKVQSQTIVIEEAEKPSEN